MRLPKRAPAEKLLSGVESRTPQFHEISRFFTLFIARPQNMRSWGSEFHEISRFFTLFIAAVGVLQHAASSSSSRLHPTKFLDFHTCGNSQASVYTFRASHSLTCTIIYVYMHVYIHVHIYIYCMYIHVYIYISYI